ncbi:MAG: winged helix-turn-helix transcriptional regulator [Thermoplasmataceae archaeon]
MDEIDKRIIFQLMKNARTPLKEISEKIGISAQALNYRVSRLQESGVIRKFSLHVNPQIKGMISGFAAFRNSGYESDRIVSRFKCLEEITIYEFNGKDQNEVYECINDATRKLGEPFMKYIPQPRQLNMSFGKLDFEIIEILKESPRLPVLSIAEKLNVKPSVARKRLAMMEKNRVINAVAEIDLAKTDSTILSIISSSVESLFPYFGDNIIFYISDRGNGIIVGYADNLKKARGTIEKIRETDPLTQVMVVYEYEFN